MQPRPQDFTIDRYSFTVNRDSKTLVTETSDLGIRAVDMVSFMRQVNESGLFMRSKDGKRWIKWVMSTREEDDGEFVLTPTTETLRAFPQLTGWSMLIIND